MKIKTKQISQKELFQIVVEQFNKNKQKQDDQRRIQRVSNKKQKRH